MKFTLKLHRSSPRRGQVDDDDDIVRPGELMVDAPRAPYALLYAADGTPIVITPPRIGFKPVEEPCE